MSTRLAYVIGRYPAASHAFIEREISALRERGIEIETISIRPALEGDLRSEADQAAARETAAVLGSGPLAILAANAAAFATRPLRYLGTLAYALRLGRGIRGRIWQLFYFAESMLVRRRVRGLGIAHIHTHFADTGSDSTLLATRFEPEWSFSITVHGPDEFAGAETNRLAEKLARASFAVAVSDDARRRALEVAPETRVEVVRLGVDLARFSPGPKLERERPRVLCLGRLVARKGHRYLLEAAAGLELELEFAGDGPEREELEALAVELGIADRVTFTGVVSQDEAVELYRGSDVFCLPSLAEGLPAVLIEAMACKLPAVTTRIDAIPELVADGESGLLVEPGDSAGLRVALGRLADDPDLRSLLGAAGRRRVAERHELGRQADQLADLFRNSSSGASMKRGGQESLTSSR